MRKPRPLDIVQTPKGATAFVTEVSENDTVCIQFLKWDVKTGEKNAWWEPHELDVLDSLPRMLGEATAHPLGNNGKKISRFFD